MAGEVVPIIEIYTKSWCPYCHMAKKLLQNKGQAFVEFDVERDPDKYEEMLGRSQGRWTVPEIFVNGRLIGGYTELKLMDLNGKLDPLLGVGD